jgi:hypothetical protein
MHDILTLPVATEKNLLFECSGSPFVLQLLQTFNKPHQLMMLMEFVQGDQIYGVIFRRLSLITPTHS